jgi:RNA polymerase sigma factor (sigma-70 family)
MVTNTLSPPHKAETWRRARTFRPRWRIMSMMDAELDEVELARRARDGDAEALAELVERARRSLFAVAYAELRHYDDAQDAVAAALLQICLHVGELREPEHVGAWMQAIVRNEARLCLRRSLPQTPAASLEELVSAAVEDAPSLLRLDVMAALQRLPWEEARAVALFYLARLPIREIAQLLGRPEGTIKRWLHLGRRRLATELEEYAPDRSPTSDGTCGCRETPWPEGKPNASSAGDQQSSVLPS